MRRALFLAVVFVCLAASPARAQDPVRVDPKHHKVEFENDQVRVLRFHLGPKETTPMHEHPANVLVSLTDVHIKVTIAGGKTEERTRKADAVVYRPAEKHAAENLSDKDYESIIVELKATSAASKPAIQSALDPAKVDPKHCKVEFENDQVRVLRWTEGPHSKVPMHEHPAYVSIWLTDGHSRYTLPDGKTREVQWKAGQVAWSATVKHASENLSDKAHELIQVELKAKPAAAKQKKQM